MDQVWIDKQGALTVVHFGAEYRSSHVGLLQQLRKHLEQLADDIDPPVLMLDLGNTDYSGAGFIGVLLHCYARIKRRDGQFAVCRLQSHLVEQIEVTNLHRLWPIYATRIQGIGALTANNKLLA
jgi:anti-anti-sigma factor